MPGNRISISQTSRLSCEARLPRTSPLFPPLPQFNLNQMNEIHPCSPCSQSPRPTSNSILNPAHPPSHSTTFPSPIPQGAAAQIDELNRPSPRDNGTLVTPRAQVGVGRFDTEQVSGRQGGATKISHYRPLRVSHGRKGSKIFPDPCAQRRHD